MGLDTVELVMEVEEAFGISISDTDAEKIQTVGQLHDHVMERLQAKPGCERPLYLTAARGPCLTAVTFYKLRRCFARSSVNRGKLRPSAALDEILPTDDRLQVWRRLADELQLALPRLVRAAWIVHTLAVVAAMTAALAMYSAAQVHGLGTGLGVGFVTLIGTSLLLAMVTAPLASYPAPEFATLGGLTRVVLAGNYVSIMRQAREHPISTADGSNIDHNPDEVFDVLRTIIMQQLGVTADEITRDASFVNDLGAD